jgi:DNA-binding transcriptional regulator GbsR (MarR family)
MFEEKIGSAAGQVWQTLNVKGPMSREQLARSTGISADMVSQAVGWLAREGKLTVDDSSRNLALLRLKK